MNNDRRKRLDAIFSTLETALNDLTTIKDEEQEAFDNMPESLQQSERGQASDEAINAMDEAGSSIESAMDGIDTAKTE